MAPSAQLVSLQRPPRRFRRNRLAVALVAPLIATAAPCLGVESVAASPTATEPLFVFTPEPPPLAAIPPPNGFLNGPCGLAVDATGNFYVADHYHHAVDVYDGAANYTTPPVYGSRGYLGQLSIPSSLNGPCGLALAGGGELYVNEYHRDVQRYGPRPGFTPGPVLGGTGTGTGVALDPGTGDVYVDERTYVGVYEPSGAAVTEGGEPVWIGLGTLADGYGAAVSTYPGTAGYVYVADAASDTVKVYDPLTDRSNPVATIAGPPGGFVSLRDAAIAVDRVTGEVYVVNDLEPEYTESPHGLVDVFDSAGNYEGHLKFEIVTGSPSGLAVDNSAGSSQGRVYVTSGNTHRGAIYAYPPGAATTAAPLIGSAPLPPLGGDSLFPLIPVGESIVGRNEQIACEGDSCQILPPSPVDPTLTTLVEGKGNPRVHYRRYRHGLKKLHHRGHGHKRGRGSVSTAKSSSAAVRGESVNDVSSPTSDAPAPAAATAALPAPPSGFDVHAWADGGAPASLSGSHPYALRLSLGLDQGSGAADLRHLRIDFPADLFVDPAATGLCGAAAFGGPRSSPFETSRSGENCPARSQIGTLQAADDSGEVRRFGLFDLMPPVGVAARLGAAPFGVPLLFDIYMHEDEEGRVHLTLDSSQAPQSAQLHGLALTLWGTPWDASHNGERGDCLSETEPSFPWGKCSAVEEPLNSPPLAMLTLPTPCGDPLAFSAAAETWSGTVASESAVNRDAGGEAALLDGCQSLSFEPGIYGLLSDKLTYSPSGFVLRLTQEDRHFVNPRLRSEPRARTAVVRLPDGVTLNPSLGAGLEGCAPAQFAAESVTDPQAAGCPNAAKIGELSLQVPFYKGELKGAIYLAKPFDNPYGSLLAVYLVAKGADRGILVKARGQLTPDPTDGTLTARFEGLSQLPYSKLELTFRSGQRAPLVSPTACGTATTRIELTPSAEGAPSRIVETDSPIEAGIESAPCPTGAPPFAPKVVAGAVNSNANSFTPYFVHISRRDSEQEITSYSMVLPAGITGKLAGIPFCPEAAIDAARRAEGFVEATHPSCPSASQVGRTVTGYGVGPSLAYSEGKIYLAGPYHGAPLSLVTINPVTIGPFDLGTIVVRSAFDLDPATAQLRIDSTASDPIPHIVDGIVLHVRDIRVYLDRPDFTHNPTSCKPSELVSTVTGSGASFGDSGDDSTAVASERFQLLNCRSLGFRPRLGLRLLGSARRGGFPALRAGFASRGVRDSNLKRIEVDLPPQLFLAQNHIRAVCSRAQFAAESCPANTVYGKAVAYTPLLDQPLRGNVYLRSSANKLPDLVASLRSGSIRIDLAGRIGPAGDGGIQVFFDDLPDAPIDRFVVLLRGGRQGLLTNSVDVCHHPLRASVKALGQNDAGAIFTTKLRGRCRPSSKRANR